MNQLLSRTFGQLQTTTNVLMQVVQSKTMWPIVILDDRPKVFNGN